MATYIVSSGVTSTGITLNHGDFLGVSSGGTASDTMANNGGTEFVYAGGTAISTTLDSGGTAFAIGGGKTSFTTVSSGGAEGVYAGGTAASTTVSSGGYLIVLPGGSQTARHVGRHDRFDRRCALSGRCRVHGLRTCTTGLVVSTSAVEFVLSGGTAISTTVDGGYQFVYREGCQHHGEQRRQRGRLSSGTASDTTVNSGGIEDVYAGGTAISTTVNSGGNEVVLPAARPAAPR